MNLENVAEPFPKPELVAPRWHTAAVLLLLMAFTFAGVVFPSLAHWPTSESDHSGRARIYAEIIAIQSLLFLLARAGIRRMGKSAREIIDPWPWNAARWGVYAGLAIAALVVWMVVGAALGIVLRPSDEGLRRIVLLLPGNALERGFWVAVSLTGSFCEEFFYRGYLLKQFRALTGSLTAALFLQAVVFSLAHAALPFALAVSVGFLALFLGALAAWRKSLAPGMLMHAALSLSAMFTLSR